MHVRGGTGHAGDTGTFRQYLRHVRPGVARQARALGLDVVFAAAQGDRLTAAGSGGRRQVIDLVGGYGTSLFGHNHPDLVAAAQACLREHKPFSAQASVRPSAAVLAELLSARVGASTGSEYVVTFGSTGADAVEAALQHAALARRARLHALSARLSGQLRRARRDGYADTPLPGRDISAAQALQRAVSAVDEMTEREPVFVALEGAFHGRSAGARLLSHTDTAHPRCRRLLRRDWNRSDLPDLFDDEAVMVDGIRLDGSGQLHAVPIRVSTIAACFAEPIQGEGGVVVVPHATLHGLRALADRHGAALVLDEIQTGMGRTGDFLASSASGVRADYYLLSKSLGGGLAKISALLVDSTAAVDDFGAQHTSTFAEDDFSADIARAALALGEQTAPQVTALGERLGRELEALVRSYPDVFVEVRGRGLLRGLELRAPRGVSPLLRRVLTDAHLGYLIAGYLLHQHGIRVLPTLTAPTVLRIQPSVYLGDADLSRCLAAFADVGALIRAQRFDQLMVHLGTAAPEVPAPPTAPRPRAGGPAPVAVTEPARVAFLANLNSGADVRDLAPELAAWSDLQLTHLTDRLLGETGPVEVSRARVQSPRGPRVDVLMIAVPLTCAQISDCQRRGEGAYLRSTVLDAVDLAVASGAGVVGLGGYTSIVTAAGRDVIEDVVRVTTGNALTAACALHQLRMGVCSRPVGRRHIAVVGAVGNIGTVMAELLAPQADSLILVGSPGSESRLHRLKQRLDDHAPVRVCTDLAALAHADVVVSATNAVTPIIGREHLAVDRPVTLCDLAVPGDLHAGIDGAAGVTVLTGGRILLPPGQQATIPASGLPSGVVYSCLAETILLGFEPDQPSCSYGALTAQNIERAADLARRHDFATLVAEGAVA